MEGPEALKSGQGLYRWHSGAPNDDFFELGQKELIEKIQKCAEKFNLGKIKCQLIKSLPRKRTRLKDTAEKVVKTFGEILVDIGKRRKDIVVLDADLSEDCGLRLFENTYPERFIENGIAEQDMVSMAGGLALQGYLPIVNSFASFLSSRSNEQIYTNATENTKIIYMCHYAGLIPAGPGKSHEWAVEKATQTCMIRLVISPSPRKILLPDDYIFEMGKGCVLKDGNNAIIFAYGPVMLNEALTAAEILEKNGFSLKVINMPWLNRVDSDWLLKTVKDFKSIFVLDDHSTYGGLGDTILNAINSSDLLRGKKVNKIGIREYPAFGTPIEVFKYHRVDGKSLSKRILEGTKNE
ncbi:MAG: transketolase family protein [Candidatus Helarchaeota archaeon]